MPHIIVKLYPGRPQETLSALTDKIVQSVVEIAECKESVVSVAIEEIEPDAWAEKVYKPDILEYDGTLAKEPGYNPFESEKTSEKKTSDLMTFVRESSQRAALEDASGYFNPMSWLDLELEDNPHSFDEFFEKPWDKLSDIEQQERLKTIRAVL